MVVVPPAIPITTPDVFTLPVAGALLLQVPPLMVSPSGSVEPAHTGVLPVRAVGAELTVTVVEIPQPLAA